MSLRNKQKESYSFWYGCHWNSLFKFKTILWFVWFGCYSFIHIHPSYIAIEF